MALEAALLETSQPESLGLGVLVFKVPDWLVVFSPRFLVALPELWLDLGRCGSHPSCGLPRKEGEGRPAWLTGAFTRAVFCAPVQKEMG